MSANYSQTNTTVVSTVDGVTEWTDDDKGLGNPWDNTDPFFSAHTRALVVAMFKCYFRHIMLYIGIPGNIICCAVFKKQGLSDRINLLLFWLAVIDCLNLAIQFLTMIPCFTSDRILVNNMNVISNAKTSRIYVTCSLVSGTLLVVMSVERCLHVVFPIRARRLLTYRSMVIAIVISYLIPIIAHLPYMLRDTVEWRIDPSTNRSIAYMAPTTWFPSENFRMVKYFSQICQPLFFTTVFVCSMVTIIHLRRMSSKRSKMTVKSGEEGKLADTRLTVMLLFLCIVYAVFSLTHICSSIINSFAPEFNLYQKYHNSFVVYYQVFLLPLSCVNSTINFCAYLVLSSKFRASLQEICPCFGRKRKGLVN